MRRVRVIKEIISRFGKNPSLLRDFHAICNTGGRFAGSESEDAAKGLPEAPRAYHPIERFAKAYGLDK